MIAAIRRFASIQARQLRYQSWLADAVRLRGNRFGCNICGWRFAEMLPTKGTCSIRGERVDLRTENANCPRCRSGIRQRFAFELLRQKTDFADKPLTILHFAPDPGIYRNLSQRPNLTYIAADLNPGRFVKALKLDITDVALADASIDGIVCIHVLEHIADDRRAIAELFRIVRPGGWGMIAVPTYGDTTFEDPTLDFAGREAMYGTGDHLRLNGLDFADKLTHAGFLVDTVAIEDVCGDFVDRAQQTPHTESDRYMFFCQKPLI